MSVISKGPRYITPIEQTNLNKAIGYVIDRLNEGATIGTWIALETLYAYLPPDLKKEMTDDYEKIAQQVAKAQIRNKSYDPLIRGANQADALTRIYRRHNLTFFEKIMVCLYRHGYREKLPRELPIGRQKGLE